MLLDDFFNRIHAFLLLRIRERLCKRCSLRDQLILRVAPAPKLRSSIGGLNDHLDHQLWVDLAFANRGDDEQGATVVHRSLE
jgi:hypothetical protein